MEKYRRFFNEIKLLNDEQFNSLSKYANFEIELPGISHSTVKLNINLKNVMPIELFKTLNEAIIHLNNQINITINGNIVVEDVDVLNDYINYFLEFTNNRNIVISNLLKRKAFYLLESGLVIISYFNNVEMNEFKQIEKPLIVFLKECGIKIDGFDYKIDEDRQKLALYKQKQLDDLAKTTTIMRDDILLKRVADDNLISIKTISSLADLAIEDRKAVIQGELFKVDKINTRKGTLYKFSLTDYSNAITIVAFEGASTEKWKSRNLPEFYLLSFKKGDWVKAQITLRNDQYQNGELNGMVDKIIKINVPDEFNRRDNSSQPRIELLAHTKMSAFDGITPVSDLIKRSKHFGASAIGITDRNNVQAYPQIMEEAKKQKQKIIYGAELDVSERDICIVKNSISQSLEHGEYVIFDIETTGLVNEFDELIEFGAVKIKDGAILDQVDWFVKATKPLPQHIVNLTHITNEMLADALDVKSALKKICEWIGKAVLIAHNGINFDLRFLNKKLEQHNLPLIKNALIDTVQVSRAVNTNLNYHTLGIIARHYKIDYDESIAHRADFDANILYSIWKILLEKLKALNITDVLQINKALQNNFLHERQYSQYMEIYCKNQKGIKDMYRLISKASTVDLNNSPRVYSENVKDNRANLIIANSPTESDVWDNALNGTQQELEETIKFYDYIFVAPPKNLAHEVGRNIISESNVKKIIVKIINTAKALNKKVAAVSDAYYLEPWEQKAHAVFIYSKLLGGKAHRLYRRDNKEKLLPDLHYRNTEEMLKEFDFLKDDALIKEIVIDNTYIFNEGIESGIEPLRTKLEPPKIAGVSDKLKEVVYQRAKELYGEIIPKKIAERIEHELNLIIEKNYSIIYWISHLLTKKSLEDGYLVGSRGSVGSSLVAYLATISEVNPLPPHYHCDQCRYVDFDVNAADGYDLHDKICPTCGKVMRGDGHNIPFETFLGFHGEKVPDIDLNFSGAYQAKAHNFIKEMFGADHTFRAGTISTIANKTAYGYVKNYFEMMYPNETINQSNIDWIVDKCTDVKRTTGQHPGGIIIVPRELDILDFTPYNYPADSKELEWYTSHFAFESLHNTLLKFDILGHDVPTSLKMLEELTKIDPKTIPFKDEKVISLFYSLDTLELKRDDLITENIGSYGLPEFGTEFVRRMLMDTTPKTFGDLIRISGLSHGTNVWINNARDLITKSNMTLSEVIACRDDIMVNLMSKGLSAELAFNVMEDVRRGKGVKQIYIETLKEAGLTDWYIDSCNKISYLFPKAHAAAYVIMAWRMAWYKVYYPLEFYATYFSVHPDVFDLKTIIEGPDAIKSKLADIRSRLASQKTKGDVKPKEKDLVTIYEVALEMYARGFGFQNIDLKKSEASRFIIENKNLIAPFSSLDGLGNIAAESIIKARNESPFISKEDLSNRTHITRNTLEVFNVMGITVDLEEDNQLSLF